mmetsp:Transcript_133295/g.297430  ORF Transcript_133295/g.297430 Transcript_133295/m.297430 type:complete len:171 (-) Transcript_133295:168-680(-)
MPPTSSPPTTIRKLCCSSSESTSIPSGSMSGAERLTCLPLLLIENMVTARSMTEESKGFACAIDFMPFPSGVGFDATAPGTAVAAALGNTGDPSASEPATTTSGDNGSASVTVIPDLKVTFPLVGYFVGEEHPDFVREDESAALSPRRPQPLVVAAVVVAAAVAALDAAT